MSLFSITVPVQHVVVRYRHGALFDVLPAGRHRRVSRARLHTVDLRERLLALRPQEILTADEVTVRITAAVRWRVTDPVGWLERAEDPVASLYLATQVALRDALGGLSAAALSGRGSALPAFELTATVDAVARGVGISVTEVVVKDVILPAELRSAALAVATARQRGAAQLEAARAETAALRALANGAQLLERHPSLARIRLVQSAPPGAQLVVHLGE